MRRLAAPLALALLLMLAGCSAIPLTGAVNTAAPQGATQPDALGFTPAKPTAGAPPADVVRGFLSAATGQQDDYKIAREYLTPEFKRRWQPNARVLVSQGKVNVSTDGTSASGPVAATLDSAGAYTPAAATAQFHLPFTLRRVNGEWRIASADNGIVLPSGLFPRLFRAVPLDFYTPDFSGLVPDLRWFSSRSDVADQVVRRLLAGATGPVAAPVTSSSFPADTTLRRGVEMTGTTALVDLEVPGGLPSTAALGRMRRQLETTLEALGGIDRVELAIGGDVQSGLRDADLSGCSAGIDAPLVLRGTSFGYLSLTRFIANTKLGAAIGKANATAVTTSACLERAAVLTRSHDVVLVAPTGKPVRVDQRAGLVAPTLDPDGWVWSVPAADPGELQAWRNGKSVSIPIDVGADSVTSIEMSRDGTRLLLVMDGQSNPQVVVTGVRRAADGTPSALTTALYDATPADPEVIDATWADAQTIALLTVGKDGTESVVLQPLGGLPSEDGTVRSASEIVGGTVQGALTVGALTVLAGRDAQQTSDGSPIWQSIGTGVTLIAVQR